LAWVDWLVVQFQVLRAVGTAIPGAEGCGSIPSALVVLRAVVRFQMLWFDSRCCGSIPSALVVLRAVVRFQVQAL
tara:strand:- start:81 stop:305 length:225 start_codon:yes stop_codon:yes gene_type:complete